MLAELERAFKGLKQQEIESRIRLSSIITRIKSDRLQKQTRGFLRSNDSGQTFGFDGWKSFGKVSGTSRNAKNLFLKMTDAYPELVFMELSGKKAALDKARNIAATISEKRMLQGYELADAIALLYCLNVAEDQTERRLEMLCVNTFRTSPFSQLMLDPQYKKTLERLLGGWSMRVEDRLFECVLMLTERDYPQAKEVALRLLDTQDLDADGYIKAMQCIYRFGSASDLPRIEKWLEDKTAYAAQQVQPFGKLGIEIYSAEYRDIALLVSMHLAGVDCSLEFPQLESLVLWGFREESLLMPPNSEQTRNERIKKWKETRGVSKK